jgi:hypothetical protein
MIKSEILSKISGTFNRVGFGVKKHSPEILIVAGVVGVVTSAVIACKATTKINTILEKSKKELNHIDDCLLDTTLTEEYTPEDAKKDKAIIYIQTSFKLVSLYAPSVLLGALSITSILASNNILRKRNVALAAAYATIDRGFKEYRNRVVERFGAEIDHELKHNIKAKQFEKTIVNEDGTETTVTETIKVAGEINQYSEYARFFDESSSYWEKDSEYNLMFLRSNQRYANDLLITKGHLFLNEVYDMLDIPRTKAGQSVGWIYDPKNPIGDNFVDFGIYETQKEKVRDFVNGYERVILLDFNVDGDILNHRNKNVFINQK